MRRPAFRSFTGEEGGEDKEIEEIFKMSKKKKKVEKSAEDIALQVEKVIAELEVVAEVDAERNRRGEPATKKLLNLSFLTDCLTKKHLQQEFLDHGVLYLLKNWLDPLPDGSLPNINVRAAILQILNDLPIDLKQNVRTEQLKKCGLGKVIKFLSQSDEETKSNRKLAQQLVDKWNRTIFNKSTRFEDMKKFDDERVFRKPFAKTPMTSAAEITSRDESPALAEFSQGPKPGPSSSRQHASRPEPMTMGFVVRPQSKVDPAEVRARARAHAQLMQNSRRVKIDKKLKQMKTPKRKQLQAVKLSAEGRGMVKYL